MRRIALQLLCVALGAGTAFAAHAQGKGSLDGQSQALDRLSAQTGASATVTIDRATGGAKFVRVAPGASLGVQSRARAVNDAGRHAGSAQFLSEYRSLFGITSLETELGAARVDKDRHGGTHFTYKQVYRGLPVFGAQLKTHFDASDNLVVANGNFVPGIDVNPTPTRSSQEAIRTAVARVKADLDRPQIALSASKPALMIYREGLAQGVEGPNHLAWQIEVSNRVDVRDFVYVDAHSGKVIDKISGIYEAKNRRAYDGAGATQPGPNYPASPFWVEGQAFPTGTVEADNMILASGEIYDLFKKRIRPRFLRRPRRQNGFDLQPRQRVPECLLERDIHLLLPGPHHRRRDRARVGPRVHRVHPRADLCMAAGGAERGVLGHLGRDRSTA